MPPRSSAGVSSDGCAVPQLLEDLHHQSQDIQHLLHHRPRCPASWCPAAWRRVQSRYGASGSEPSLITDLITAWTRSSSASQRYWGLPSQRATRAPTVPTAGGCNVLGDVGFVIWGSERLLRERLAAHHRPAPRRPEPSRNGRAAAGPQKAGAQAPRSSQPRNSSAPQRKKSGIKASSPPPRSLTESPESWPRRALGFGGVRHSSAAWQAITAGRKRGQIAPAVGRMRAGRLSSAPHRPPPAARYSYPSGSRRSVSSACP